MSGHEHWCVVKMMAVLLTMNLVQGCTSLSDRSRMLTNDGRWKLEKDLQVGNDVLNAGTILTLSSNLSTVVAGSHVLVNDLRTCEIGHKPLQEKCTIPLQQNACAVLAGKGRFHLIGASGAGEQGFCMVLWMEDADSEGNSCTAESKSCALQVSTFVNDESFSDGGGGGGSARGLPRPQSIRRPLQPSSAPRPGSE